MERTIMIRVWLALLISPAALIFQGKPFYSFGITTRMQSSNDWYVSSDWYAVTLRTRFAKHP